MIAVPTWFAVVVVLLLAGILGVLLYLARVVRPGDLAAIGLDLKATLRETNDAVKRLGEELRMWVREQMMEHERAHHGRGRVDVPMPSSLPPDDLP